MIRKDKPWWGNPLIVMAFMIVSAFTSTAIANIVMEFRVEKVARKLAEAETMDMLHLPEEWSEAEDD